MTADRTAVHVGEPFHLTISAHVDEEVLELDNVTLPDLYGFESLGDERRCTATPRGTDCVETLTLDATEAGDRTIGPTTMDAIDARNGKPSIFATNSVTIHVAGPAPLSVASGVVGAFARTFLFVLFRALGIAALLALCVVLVRWAFGRPRTGVTPQPLVSASPPPLPTRDERLRDRVGELAREPTRERAMAVRALLREELGARDDETLGDLSARRAGSDANGSLAALAAIERAVFCEDERVAEAVREALPSLKS